MGKTKESEAEYHSKLRSKQREELNKYKAIWEFLEKKTSPNLGRF